MLKNAVVWHGSFLEDLVTDQLNMPNDIGQVSHLFHPFSEAALG